MSVALRSGIPHTVWLDDLAALRTAQIMYAAADAELKRRAAPR